MSSTPARVDAAIFGEVRRYFDEAQLVELISAIAWENFRSRFNRALDIQAAGFYDEELREVQSTGSG